MQVRVLFFGPLVERLGCREERLEMPAAAQAGDVYRHYFRREPAIGAWGRDLLVAVNEEFSNSDHPLREGDEIAFLPPMSGGSPETPAALAAEPSVLLTREPIVSARWREAVSRPEHGGIVVFEGVARNHHQGKAVMALEYEAYEPMALKRLRAIATQVLAQWPVGAVAVVHRLGRLEVGEVSVLVAVGAAHRRPAFEACSFAIDAIKRSVPIWKKEWSPDGAWWTEGALPTASDLEADRA